MRTKPTHSLGAGLSVASPATREILHASGFPLQSLAGGWLILGIVYIFGCWQ